MDMFGPYEGASFDSIGQIITDLLPSVFALAGMLALLFLIWGGIRYMTARGDPKNVDSARGIITSAIIGLMIVLLSAILFYFVGSALKFDIFTKLLAPPAAQAQVNIGDTVDLGNLKIGAAFDDIGGLFTNVVRLALGVAGLVFMAMIFWGGIRYLNAGGDPKNAESARGTLTNAGIGLLIVVVSLAIIEIITSLFGFESIFG